MRKAGGARWLSGTANGRWGFRGPHAQAQTQRNHNTIIITIIITIIMIMLWLFVYGGAAVLLSTKKRNSRNKYSSDSNNNNNRRNAYYALVLPLIYRTERPHSTQAQGAAALKHPLTARAHHNLYEDPVQS